MILTRSPTSHFRIFMHAAGSDVSGETEVTRKKGSLYLASMSSAMSLASLSSVTGELGERLRALQVARDRRAI